MRVLLTLRIYSKLIYNKLYFLAFRIFLFITLISLSFIPNKISCQQTINFNLLRSNLSTINPANLEYNFIHFKRNNRVALSHLSAWSGAEGAPNTAIANAEFLFARDDVSMVMGGNITSDKAGRLINQSAAYRIGVIFSDDLSERGLSFGLSASLQRYRLDTQEISIDSYQALQNYLGSFDTTFPNVGFGMFSYNTRYDGLIGGEDFYYSGISIPFLLSIPISGGEDEFFDPSFHVYGNAGYVMRFLDDFSYLELASWTKYEHSSKVLQSDLTLKYQHEYSFNLTVGYSTSNFFITGFGLIITPQEDNIIELSYGGRFNLGSRILRNFGVQHEVTLSYSFGEDF